MKTYEMLNKAGQVIREIELPEDGADISDGYHTFGELYDHRRALTAVLAATVADDSSRAGVPSASWRSKAHHPDDSPMFEGGYFIVGIELDSGTITYHYKLAHWDDFAAVPELEHAPKWDGATPADTVTRLKAVADTFAQAQKHGSDVYGWDHGTPLKYGSDVYGWDHGTPLKYGSAPVE